MTHALSPFVLSLSTTLETGLSKHRSFFATGIAQEPTNG